MFLKTLCCKYEIKRVMLFGGVGGIATLVHMGFANLALWFECTAMQASFIGFLPAVLFSYFGHRYVTYSDAKAGSKKRFLVVAISGFLVSLLVLNYLKLFMPWVALCLSIGVIPIWSYFMNRFWVFQFK